MKGAHNYEKKGACKTKKVITQDALAEYSALRSEISTRIASNNSMYLNMYIIFGTILTAVLTSDVKEVFLACIILLIPLQLRINRTMRMIDKFGAYIEVFFEQEGYDMYWESMNSSNDDYEGLSKTLYNYVNDPFSKIHTYTPTIMGVLMVLFYAVSKYQQIAIHGFLITDWVIYILCLLTGGGLCLWLFFINGYYDKRQHSKLNSEELIKAISSYKDKVKPKDAVHSASVGDETPNQDSVTPN